MVAKVSDDLRHTILSGRVPLGRKLPSEAALTGEYAVSRTVVREAIAQLRSEGLVESRQGAGVFVIATQAAGHPTLNGVDPSRISSIIEVLELRAAIEIEAAGLASQRRSPAQNEAIHEACEAIEVLIERGEATVEADFAFHLAITDGTNNARFRQFLEMLGRKVIPRGALQDDASERTPADYLRQIQTEHRLIADAISERDEAAARAAMRQHLQGSQERYRRFQRRS
ncbi:FadR/GntR family transcriptional regulator [Fulvimarina sp. 2208YS6-2-32]|uniref:FadR/GntR family transcriptional regulator n=1 Tax=Fulvimarina uroteuthidis TaxID=3098149 RepID=A0ABU5I2D9_9HYPH|nr:FadR/GntR family transcriptional regulator [Fulvimarina sp. 2208YS6-2-32]MDY8108938.1 FadR/GntR family transcriptional regulator [Fulvimarina sp. 2208YS6-2-32]